MSEVCMCILYEKIEDKDYVLITHVKLRGSAFNRVYYRLSFFGLPQIRIHMFMQLDMKVIDISDK